MGNICPGCAPVTPRSASASASASGETDSESSLSPHKSDADATGSEIDSGSHPFLPSPTHYQVFLSFSSADDEMEHADRIYRALVDAGIRVLKDHYRLDAGGQLHQELVNLIEHCEIFIPILSCNYVRSERCLQELTWMLSSPDSDDPRHLLGRSVEPIFYNREAPAMPSPPSFLGKSFRQHRSKWEPHIVLRWEYALRRGYEFHDYGLQGQELVFEALVAKVSVYFRKSPLSVTESLIGDGINIHVEAIIELLDLGAEDVKAVGIYGIGGIGKTTLAKVTCDRISDRFEGLGFLLDIGERSREPRGLETLQAQLLATIVNQDQEAFANVDEGKKTLRNLLGDKKVLILLDGVDHGDQLRALARPDWLAQGSKIIVTGRDRHVLDELVRNECLYRVTEMPGVDFRLRQIAFAPPYIELFSIPAMIAKLLGGLPLALRVVGSLLHGKTRNTWLATLEGLRNIKGEPQSMLRIAFDALHYEAKVMFLDIACFLNGTDVRFAFHMWDACDLHPEFGILDLRNRDLIKITDDSKLWMHDLLRDMGREIVQQESTKEPGRRSGLHGTYGLDVIERTKGTQFIEAICLDYAIGAKKHVSDKHMPDLRFLDRDAVAHLAKLRWFGWHGTTRFDMPSHRHLKNLVVLDLSKSAVNDTWDEWSTDVKLLNLKVLNFTNCHQLARTPDFSSFPHIEMLILKDCSALSAVDTSIGHLKDLRILDLRNCLNLEKLPDEIGLLVGLEELLLDGCESITELPTSIGQLNSLKVLSLSRSKVSRLPDSFQNSSNLKVLNIDHCPMRSLPSSIWKLERLEVLNASGCLNLCGEIPSELTNLNLLRILRLDHTSVTCISRSIVGLSRLETLDLEGCMKLHILPELPTNLVNLKVTRTAAEAVPNLVDLINLRQLEVLNCSSDLRVRETTEEPSSSSSFALQPGYKYEVFLSFRGPDTRTTFTDSLYCRLSDAGIRTYRDDEELRLGEEIGQELLEAIEQSRVSIPIFSTGYASSKWCLMEVAKMVECKTNKKQIIIPIFYDVTPYQVRHQTGTYDDDFSIHEKKFDNERVCKWRDALAEVGALKGRDFNNGYHGRLISEIVSEVHKLLKKSYLDVTKQLVGVEDHMEKVMKLLEIKTDDNRVVGICGMGGIGKTTIAKFIYNQLRDEFDCCSFLKDIRVSSLMWKGLESLQRQLVSDVLRRKCEKFANTDAGKAELARSLRDRKVLILLDDVDETEQLNGLVGDLSWLGRGSRIIITTRNVDALRMSDVFRTAPEKNASVYQVEAMHPQNAFLLFCKHAFRQDFPLPRFAIISWKIVEATGRLPLAVKAIGSYLSNFQEKTKVWEEALRSLKTRTDILGILKISYEGLSREQRDVFLDIVCLFTGMDSRIPVHVWKACGFSPETTIEDLLLRSLIRIGDHNELLMHDLYIELGREIIREESRRDLANYSRLWCREDAIHVLQHEKGTENVRAVNLDNGVQSKKCCFSRKKFEKLSNVWFLGLGDANLVGNFSECLSDLRWLSHHGDDFYIPDGLNMESLVVLDLSRSTINENWDGWNSLKDAESLEVLNLSSCHRLTSTPNFPRLPRMKRLILEDCRGLSVVGPSVMELKALEFLDMRNCSSLEYLPKELGSLGELTELLLDGSSVQELPLSSNMRNLEIVSAKSSRSLTRLLWSNGGPLKLKKLFLDDCEALTDIPDSIGRLQSLTDLSLPRTSVSSIPESVGNLSNLELLNIDRCPIKSLPHSLWQLEKLEVISASGCVRLRGEIPSGIGNLTSLRILRLDHTNVSSIAPTIEMLRSLHTLNLKGCKIRTLPNLPSSLVCLKVTCRSSVTIPNPSDLVHLKELEVVLLDKKAKVAKEIEKFSKIEKVKIAIV